MSAKFKNLVRKCVSKGKMCHRQNSQRILCQTAKFSQKARICQTPLVRICNLLSLSQDFNPNAKNQTLKNTDQRSFIK